MRRGAYHRGEASRSNLADTSRRPHGGQPMQATSLTASEAYRAPFAPGGPSAIDAEICRKLLTIALSRGGDYADVFFEYRATGSLSFAEGITRSASRGTSV